MKISPYGNVILPRKTPFALAARDDDPRSPGLHQSAISGHLMRALGHYEDSTMDWDRIEAGLVMEAIIDRALAERHLREDPPTEFGTVIRPGEFWVDTAIGPIYVTPDGYSLEQDRGHEIKATWYSGQHPLTDWRFFPWRIQMMLGAKALGVLEWWLHVFYVNGDYKPPAPWPIKSFLFTFSPTDLDECVAMLVNFVKDKPELFHGH